MSFGDWEMFKVILISLREHEISNAFKHNENTNVRMSKNQERKGDLFFDYLVYFFLIENYTGSVTKREQRDEKDGSKDVPRKSSIEKQVGF